MSSSNQKWYKESTNIITVFTAVIVMLTTVLTAYFTKDKDIREIFVSSPDLDKIDFVEYFGLQKDKIFNYEVQIKSIDNGAEYDSIYTAKVKVLNIQKRDNITLVELNNDLFFPQRRIKKFYLIFLSNQVFSIPQEKSKKFAELFIGDKYEFDETDFEILADYNLPFFNKQIFASTIPHALRGDKMYINHVQYEATSNYFDGKKMIERSIYRIYNQTLSDESYSEFVPYFGFTKHTYHHNGSRVEYAIELKNTEK